MREEAHRRSRRTLTLAVTAAVVLGAGAVGAWAGGLVRPAHQAAVPAVPKKAVPLWVAGGHKSVAPAAAAAAATAKPAKPATHAVKPKPTVRARPHRTKPATHPSRKLTATPPPVDLCAKAGTATMPDGITVPIWGFALLGAAPTCDDPSVVASLPGPQIDATVGDVLTVHITNAIPGRTISIEAPGVDVAGTQDAATGATVSITFAAPEGTYLYESGGDAGRQEAMGLYGAFVVHSATAGQADGVAFDAERTLVLSEVDPAFNANPTGFDMNAWHPAYYLINGKGYPATTNDVSVTAGQRLLLRWANAGVDHHTMSMLGLHQRLLARGGNRLTAPYDVVSETFPAGETADGLVTAPATATSGDAFPIYNRNMNRGQTFFLRVP